MIYASNSGTLQLESTAFAGGRINLATSTGGALTQDIQYHHTDHLGSVRAITNQSGETVEQNAYYPFGERHTFGNTYAQTTNRFKYNGKEEQTTGNLQYLDYGARMYDSKVARWFVQDPLSEKYYAQSQYNYCVNNPVMFVDPDGKDVRVTIRGNTVRVEANIILYQANGKVNTKTVDNMKQQIVSAWDRGVLHPWIYDDGKSKYDILFDINVTAADRDSRTLKKNYNGVNNYIEIREGDDYTKPYSFVRGTNDGMWYRNFTQADHEFGHILGLKDRCIRDSESDNVISDVGYGTNVMGAFGQKVSQQNINDFMKIVVQNAYFLNQTLENYVIIYINDHNREK